MFLDIETVPETTDFTQLDKEAQDLYAAKTAYKRKAANLSAEDYYSHAGIWAEFGNSFYIKKQDGIKGLWLFHGLTL